ncbi:MAG: DUF4262 domain-containing protein [Janthinobacterium lividum]
MTDEQLMQYHYKVEQDLQQYGYYSTFVFSKDKPSFCYSTGIYKNFGIPEIFISSLPPNLSYELISNYLNKFKESKSVPLNQRIVDLTDRFFVYLIDVPISEVKDYALASIKFYENIDLKYIQLIYPDIQGNFPNDSEYDYDQIVLGDFIN